MYIMKVFSNQRPLIRQHHYQLRIDKIVYD